MSTHNRNSGGSRSQKKSNSGSGGGGGCDSSISTQTSLKKTEGTKTEKEKSHPKPTAEQLRIAQITNSNTSEDPQMREKVATLIEMTQRSEEEVCCALNECDNNLERAVVFLLETLPVGAFETSSKKKKNKVVNAAQDNSVGGDGDWADGNANTDKREKSRNRNNSNRGGRGGSDSRGWRGREARENERNSRGGGGGGGDRDDRVNDNYRGGPRSGGDGRRGGSGGGRGGGYVGRGSRVGGRISGGRGTGGRGDRSGNDGGGYRSRYNNSNDDHQEVELWDNSIAQSTEKQQQQTQDDAWGDWDNEEYVGSLKDSKVFTTSNLPNQTAASVLSSGLTVSGDNENSAVVTSEISAPPGLEHHLGTSVIGGTSASQAQGSHLNSLVDDNSGGSNLITPKTTPMMQYSAAVSSTPQLQQQQQSSAVLGGTGATLASGANITGSSALGSSPYGNAVVDTFSNAATAAANLVQQVQQQQQQQQHLTPQLKSSTTLSAEQEQYFSSLVNHNAVIQVKTIAAAQARAVAAAQAKAAATAAAAAVPSAAVSNVQQIPSYAQNPATVQYQTSYANVFGSAAGSGSAVSMTADPTSQLNSGQQPQVRRARAKLPPPSKIPSSAVEMPGDALNNIGYLDVQFGGLDFGTDDSFENLSEKLNNSVNLVDGQQQSQQQQQQQQKALSQSTAEANLSYEQSKSVVAHQQQQQQQQSALTATGLQTSHLTDSLTASYTQRAAAQQQQQQQQPQTQLSNNVSGGSSGVGSTGSSALDQLTKNDHYNQNSNSAAAYQNSYQSSNNVVTNKGVSNAYQQSVASQGYNNSAYGNVQSSVANSYQPQAYGSYQQNSISSYQQQQQQQQSSTGTQSSSNVTGSNSVGVGGGSNSTQNIPSVGGNNSNSATANSNSNYLTSAYGSQQNAYQSSQSVYGGTGLSNNSGFAGSTSTASSQYSNFSSGKLKDTSASSNASHYESVSSSSAISNSGTAVNSVSSGVNSNNAVTNSMISSTHLGALTSNSNVNSSSSLANNSSSNSSNLNNSNSTSNVVSQTAGAVNASGNSSSSSNNTSSSTVVSAGGVGVSGGVGVVSSSSVVAASSAVSSTSNKTGSGVSASGAPTGASGAGSSGGSAGSGAGGMVPNIQMVSQYIQTSLPYYQQPVYSYEDLQMMQQRVPHVQGYYDLNYTPTSLGAGRDNLGSVAYSTMTDGRFTRTDNNSSPVSNVSTSMSQQAGSSAPMLNVPYAYFYGGNVMPGSFQYGTPAIYPQIPAANTASGGQFPKPSYNTGYGSTNYDALTQASQDYTKGTYPTSVNQQTKSQNVTNPPQAGTASDITSSMYGKGHVALNKVNSYEKQNFHSGTPPPFNMANTQTAGGTSAQPYGMYLPTMPAAGHHMIHPPIHQDSNSTGQRQPTSSQSKSATKQGYSPSYWTGQN